MDADNHNGAGGGPAPTPRPRPEGVRILGEDEDLPERQAPAPPPDLPHWTEPPTGEIPISLGGGTERADDDIAAWAGFAGPPRWRDQASDWEAPDFTDTAALAHDTRLGALADEPVEILAEGEPPEVTVASPAPDIEPTKPTDKPPTRTVSSRPTVTGPTPPRRSPTAVRIVSGLGIGFVALGLFAAGPAPTLALVTAVAVVSALELFGTLHKSGYRPATLVALLGTVGLMVGTYFDGEAAFPLVVAAVTVFTFLWYLVGVTREAPAKNAAVTLLGFLWIGGLGSFAGLLLDPTAHPQRHGVAFVLGVAVATVSYDVVGYFVGSRFGRHRLAPGVSPGKTWEGLLAGAAATIVVSTLVIGRVHPWHTSSALALGLVAAVAAPLGDLSESLVKRDLGIKDMGTILPGHGGITDRIDAMLFVLPAVYYLVRLLGIG
ncbi:MAG TPA: phosphatidate cytidylyltransferase [Acidimicrobiales bacterium]|nr:phosphatidate cytidylyltransferase [Acidimicrobiales bacterium]